MRKARIAIIGGTGFDDGGINGIKTRVGTPYGPSPTLTVGKIDGNDIVFLPRHDVGHKTPPHMINNRANISALHSLGVERILAINAVGAINPNFKSGDIVIPHDFLDFTWSGHHTFYDNPPVTHVDVSTLYCPELREILLKAATNHRSKPWAEAVYVNTTGPRYESPAEVRMLRTLGGDIVGMSGIAEAVLAHELEMCYATLCFVTNMAAGMQSKISTEEVAQQGKDIEPIIREVLEATIANISKKRSCPCSNALEGARM